jgi:type I restriction enzyme S subunit
MSEWREYKLGEITTKIGSGATPRGGSGSYKDHGITLIRSQNVLDLSFSSNGIAYIDEEQAGLLNNVTIEENDILLNITGDSVARACKVPKHILPARVNQHVAIIRADRKKSDPDYILYYLQYIKEFLLVYSEIGGTRNALTKGMIENIEILLPPLPEQKAIASVLSSLDDKIDLLHRQNETLEQLAETLFRQWFIEEAQDDWLEYQVQDIARHVKEGVNPMEFPTEEFNHYSLPAFDNGRTPVVELGSSILSNKFRMAPNSVLVSKLNPRVPRIWLISDNLRKNSVCSTEFQVILPHDAVNAFFLFCLFMSDDAINELTMAASGTSGSHQRVRPEDILKLKFKTPSLKRVADFSTAAQPLFEKIIANIEKAVSLSNLRDTLLPKLMSGEVLVKH